MNKYNDRKWWNRARAKLMRIARKYNMSYTVVAHTFACMLYNNTIKGARKCLYRYLNTGEIKHRQEVRLSITVFNLYGQQSTIGNVDLIYRAFMGDESVVPLYTGCPSIHETVCAAKLNGISPLQQQAIFWARDWRSKNPGKRLPYV